jgi:hypothetical protein
MRNTARGRLTPIPFDTPVITYTDILSDFNLVWNAKQRTESDMDCKSALESSYIYTQSHLAASLRNPKS